MAKEVFPGRFTTVRGEKVVFLIGIRVNRRRAVHKWLPVFNSMPGMIRELYTQKD